MENKNNSLLLISIKPQYAKKIFKGEKTIELRKSAPLRAGINSYMLIYVTSPVKELWGICKIASIIKDKPEALWEKFGEKTGIAKDEFDVYYEETNNAFGLELKEVKSLLNHTIKLEKLKKIIPGFNPPQTYRYIDNDLINHNELKELFI
ncbi:ASCH domain-containing protein [Flavobacterium sp. MMLR14_040]|uniref:ASCH domain-containing protein n=1 Tax=Flavobacterium sp. MMLR14_040 TaxID=3093843 RepID=UPI00298F979C|nr:ASCH domain-containing protein [Flavobacterium sp. MMLR14_040]MDW8850124.1 ASCH domain-containing protein [Flavobacterium sp. MMLR14_040]